jgi:hypothetical protein
MTNTTKIELKADSLYDEAVLFCEDFSKQPIPELSKATDGKAVGTLIEKRFKEWLSEKYVFSSGNAARGIDLPSINTDIKATSVRQPQSSCPYKSSEQKIYGLGYNLLVMVYEKDGSTIIFDNVTYIPNELTGDFNMTKELKKLKNKGADETEIRLFLNKMELPGKPDELDALAKKVLTSDICEGYLTISNALQWRLQYARAIHENNSVRGIKNHDFESKD